MKNERIYHINNIMSKCHGIFTNNFTIFFFKLKTRRNFNLTNFGRPPFVDDMHVTMIS